jgi:hypothetical protein
VIEAESGCLCGGARLAIDVPDMALSHRFILNAPSVSRWNLRTQAPPVCHISDKKIAGKTKALLRAALSM